MNDAIFDRRPERPLLPEPQRGRWQPLRLGLVELFHYDSEEFWFRDGHLLLRGNNGTGKSKVLSLTLPFLLDARLLPSRIEPDGDNGKKMAWNLLMSSHQRRIGYAWVEFGRRSGDGSAQYLTLGAGLSAVAGRPQVDSWFFILDAADDGPRINQDLWFTGDQRVVLTRERLRDAIEGRGQVFESASSYRRAVDERLFQLGQRRYEALMDTLIQLRQPQLSKKPDEAGLSHALTEALPPLPQELLTDVAEALNQLEEDRRQLQEVKELARAVKRFDERYRIYTGMLSRRQARTLRQTQTDFDNASHARNQAQDRLRAAQDAETAAVTAQDEAKRSLAGHRARQEALQADPTMQDASRLEYAEADAARRRTSVATQQAACAQAQRRLQEEQRIGRRSAQRAADAEQALLAMREECAATAADAGIATRFGGNPLAVLPPEALVELAERDFGSASDALRQIAATRREELAVLRCRQGEMQDAVRALTHQQHAQRERRTDLEAVTGHRAKADAMAEEAGQMLVDAWHRHCAGLIQLRLDGLDPLSALTDWVARADGDNPAHQALRSAQQQASLRHAAQQTALDGQRSALQLERATLENEQAMLEAGRDTAPPPPHTRGAETRSGLAGAPLWQLTEFHEHVDAAQRAGLEAALEASGLLDAWVTPDGMLVTTEDRWLDSQWTLRPPLSDGSLAGWLRAARAADMPVPATIIDRLLAGVPCGTSDQGTAEAWIAPDGRFRLGALTGAWAKPQAVHIGHTARAGARRRRLAEIAERLRALAAEQADLLRRFEQLDTDRRQAEQEWRGAPSDQALRQALLDAGSSAREVQTARGRLDHAEAACREAEQGLRAARDILHRDAADMGLPTTAEALSGVEAALQRFSEAQFLLAQAAKEWQRAHPELQQQRSREADAQAQWEAREAELADGRLEAEQAQARFEVLREAVGAQVDSLRRQLAAAREAVRLGDAALTAATEARRLAGEARAASEAAAGNAAASFEQRAEARVEAVIRLQQFAASSLLASALPALEVPDLRSTWTIDPALTLARRIEQELALSPDDDAHWARTQRQINEDLQELQRALSALGHQAPAETSDWGFIVRIIIHNRPERPDQLAVRLAEDIAQRSDLLSAKEREVLENYLQAEIASEVQRLLRSAEAQVDAINRELHKRPTSTGVRYRLRWQPLGEDEGGPAGLDAVRGRLLNTSADLWSAEDRRVVGTMLQQRIIAERERADSGLGGAEDSGGLIDQLARALDYRRWHRFRVERLQDGQWRKLSGPASSGERALGLTVPLFAAVASFYSQGSSPHAPRLMLLDEAFAGIDDAARAHCMGLIREFDLDFVITSEREWACYAELPGVSICQLQRREGVEAVFVSRWSWDGQARRPEADPDRRFAAE